MQIGEVFTVPLSDIGILGGNVRSDLDSENSQEGLDELAESIEANGLMQPIVLRGVKDSPPYDVIVGQRRFLAHKKLGKPSIKAVFVGQVTDTEALILSLSENLLRQEMKHADIARAVTSLYEEFGKDERQVQKKLGLSIRAIRNYLIVDSQATPKIKALLDARKISPTDAKRVLVASQGDSNRADSLVDELVNLTKYEKIRFVEVAKANPKASTKDIVETAKKPRVEETLILNLPFKIAEALNDAIESLKMDYDEIITSALTSWLATNDFLLLEDETI